jgi:hypothetical protein
MAARAIADNVVVTERGAAGRLRAPMDSAFPQRAPRADQP